MQLVEHGLEIGWHRALEREALSLRRVHESEPRRVQGLALGTLSRLGESEPRVKADGHSYTHVIGIRAWQPGQDLAQVFRSCTGLYQSGRYHGVIQAYLIDKGDVDSGRVAGLCDLIEGPSPDRWLRFQCVHGVGHGLEMIWNWDLPRSLEGCDWLPTAWDREGCYGGAFMENAVASMPGGGHHTSARAIAETRAADPEPGHGDHGSPDPAAITFHMRDSTDALYPCSIVGQAYLSSCYMLQGSLILQRTNFDFARAAAVCDRLGTQPPHASWGRMLNEAQTFMGTSSWLAIFPGCAIAFAVLGFNLLGDGLRDMLDPKLARVEFGVRGN